MRTVLAEPTQTAAKGVLTCLTTSADPSTLSVVDLKGRETRTQFFPLSAEQCWTTLWKNCSPEMSWSKGRKQLFKRGRWSRCTVATSVGLQSFGSVPILLLPARFNLPWGDSIGDCDCGGADEATNFALCFVFFGVFGVRLGSPATSAAPFKILSLSSVSCSSSTSSVCVGSEDGAGSFWSDWLIDAGSSRGTILSSHRGCLLWIVTSSRKFSLDTVILLVSVERSAEKCR